MLLLLHLATTALVAASLLAVAWTVAGD